MTRSFSAFLLCVAFSSPAVAASDTIGWIRDLKLAPGAPLVILPPTAGAVIGVDEQRKSDVFIQTITLAGDPGVMGENTVTVTVTKGGFAPRISENTINDEVAEVLPGLPLTMGPVGTQNMFGEFGALEGTRADLGCVYAWQRVNLADKWVTGHRPNPFDRTYAMTMRYRICRTRIGADELVAAVGGAQSGRTSSGLGARPFPIAGADPLAAASTLGPTFRYGAAPVPHRDLADRIGSALGLEQTEESSPVAGYGGTVAGNGPVVVLAAPAPVPMLHDLEIRRAPRARVASRRRAPRAEVANREPAQAVEPAPAAPPVPAP